MPATHIHLVRHAEVDNPDKLLYGRIPRFRLTPGGFGQAEQTALFLAGRDLAAIFSSPLLRARQTAAPIARYYPGFKVHISQWLNEVRTTFEGRPGKELDARQGDIYSDCGPESEQPADIVYRLHRFLGVILKRFPEKQIAAVTHGDVITFGVVWAKGARLVPQNKSRLMNLGYPAPYPGHASVTTLIFPTPSLTEIPEVIYRQP